jgi:hypothetical protein
MRIADMVLLEEVLGSTETPKTNLLKKKKKERDDKRSTRELEMREYYEYYEYDDGNR